MNEQTNVDVADVPQPPYRGFYTHRTKGGQYRGLGIMKGAGESRGQHLIGYIDPKGQAYFRFADDFERSMARLDPQEVSRGLCGDPLCGCGTPTFATVHDALDFLAGRFRFAGVADGVAQSYAKDIDLILAAVDHAADDDVYVHTLDNTEGIPTNEPEVWATFQKQQPFGKPGVDFSESFPITTQRYIPWGPSITVYDPVTKQSTNT
jgi:hypothetical protein